jgi:hypothetical protein
LAGLAAGEEASAGFTTGEEEGAFLLDGIAATKSVYVDSTIEGTGWRWRMDGSCCLRRVSIGDVARVCPWASKDAAAELGDGNIAEDSFVVGVSRRAMYRICFLRDEKGTAVGSHSTVDFGEAPLDVALDPI